MSAAKPTRPRLCRFSSANGLAATRRWGLRDGYIPAGVGAEEIRAAIEGSIAAGVTQIGPMMKALKDQFGARLDGKLASEMVKEALARK
jgi:uncharacterized protein YqeY